MLCRFRFLSLVVFLLASGASAGDMLTLSFTGVQPLVNGFHYEGWAIVGGVPVTTGKFNVDANGALVDLAGNVIANGEFDVEADLSQTAAIVLTIEPDGDTDTDPAATHYLAGGVNDGSAMLTVGHAAALGDDFAKATGAYILATPTDTATTNENSGIWFLDLSSGSPAKGLDLPTLPAGWAYEGWVVMGGSPVTTGTFTDPAAADLSAPFSGTQAGPPFPGEDYLMNAPSGLTFPTNLAGATAVISIEPSPDDAAGPFTLKPLVGMIPDTAKDHVTYSLDNKATGFPWGTATIQTTVSVEEIKVVPGEFRLLQNYPNPFNPTTIVPYDLPERVAVVLTIYDILGREIRTLVQGVETPGSKSVLWDAKDEFGRSVSPGVYLYRIKATYPSGGSLTQTHKMVLLK